MTIAHRLSVVSIIAVAIAAILSRIPLIAIGSVQPNLILIVLLTAALFTRNTAFFAVLVGIATLLGRATPFLFDRVTLGITVAAFIVFVIKQRVVWPDRIGVVILAPIATLLTYSIAVPRFIITHPGLLLLEVAANVLVAMACFELFTLFVGKRNQ
jgi:hypothetical protein